MWEIRPANAGDAAQLSQIAQEIFYDTFGPFNRKSDMDLYCGEAFSQAALAATLADPDIETIVAAGEHGLIAYTQLQRSPAPEEVSGSGPIEVMRFYIQRAWHGAGLARELMRSVAARSVELGCGTVWLGVWEHNPRAIRFYEKCGFAIVGAHPFLLGTDLQRDLLMAAPIDVLRKNLDSTIPRTGSSA
jgi:GNAT superfamily N-acetyltransferase